MRKTIRIMMWFLRKLYQCDKKRFGSMAALIVIRAIKTLLSVITIKVALDCVVTYHSFLYLVIFVATERVVSSLLALIEAEMYERMFAAGKDRTMILISHRLYSTRKADRICYIENGKIVEEGTHEDLMRANGKYASMYQLQASLYEKEEN